MTVQQDPERDRLIEAVLRHVPFDGWTRAALAAAAKDSGIEPAVADIPLGDRSSMAFSGTFVTAGTGVGIAVATGTKKATPKALAEAAAQPTGYHASEHIKKYYKTTEV